MTDEDRGLLDHIGELVEEEKNLRGRHMGTPLSGAELNRLEDIEAQLDQCWDLLSQRRALREFGMDDDQAAVRGEDVVEGYQQ
jgi:Protein of unknown function (DUF2630)